MTIPPEPQDPIAARRARIARWAQWARRCGYGALLASIGAFVAAAATDFASPTVAIAVGFLVAAVVVLPAPIVIGYGVRAAEREERRNRSAPRSE